jgi:small conductance mechanosensitive channel
MLEKSTMIFKVLRDTILSTLSKRIHIRKKKFKNPHIGITLECGVGYDSNLDQIEELTKRVIVNEFEQIESKEEVDFYYIGFAHHSINYTCRFWIREKSTLSAVQAKSRALQKIKMRYEENNINILFPIRTLQIVR